MLPICYGLVADCLATRQNILTCQDSLPYRNKFTQVVVVEFGKQHDKTVNRHNGLFPRQLVTDLLRTYYGEAMGKLVYFGQEHVYGAVLVLPRHRIRTDTDVVRRV